MFSAGNATTWDRMVTDMNNVSQCNDVRFRKGRKAGLEEAAKLVETTTGYSEWELAEKIRSVLFAHERQLFTDDEIPQDGPKIDISSTPFGDMIPGTMQTNLIGKKAVMDIDDDEFEVDVKITSVYAIKTLVGRAFAALVIRADNDKMEEVLLSDLTFNEIRFLPTGEDEE